MKDVLVLLMTIGFFAVCVAYVALCDRVVGPDDADDADDADDVDGAGEARDTADSSGVEPTRTATAVGGAR